MAEHTFVTYKPQKETLQTCILTFNRIQIALKM